MSIVYSDLFPAMWCAFLAYWWVMSRGVKDTTRREALSSRLVRTAAFAVAVVLLVFPGLPLSILDGRFLPRGAWCFWSGAAVTAAGLLFAVWARRHLGSNWSQAVTVKEDHELIMSGPYALVRHPIYSGLLLGFLGSAIALAEWRGLVAVALVLGVLWPKLNLEEQWMRAQFGELYDAYARRVSALLPHVI